MSWLCSFAGARLVVFGVMVSCEISLSFCLPGRDGIPIGGVLLSMSWLCSFAGARLVGCGLGLLDVHCDACLAALTSSTVPAGRHASVECVDESNARAVQGNL